MEQPLFDAVVALLAHVQKLYDDHIAEQFPTDLKRPEGERLFVDKFSIEGGKGRRFARVVCQGRGDSRRVWGFVALVDGETRQLGHYKVGDVFYPDGWKAPAKNVRGNVFDQTTWKKFTHHSPGYLR